MGTAAKLSAALLFAASTAAAEDASSPGSALCGEYALPRCFQAEFEKTRLPAVSKAVWQLLPDGRLRERGRWSPNAEACERDELPVRYQVSGVWSATTAQQEGSAEDVNNEAMATIGDKMLNVTLEHFIVRPEADGQVCTSPRQCIKTMPGRPWTTRA